jgi:MFS family permease
MSLRTNLANRFPALASRDFSIFLSGQFISLIGTWMQSTTQPLLAYRLSGSPFDLGLIGFAQTLPTFLLALPGGVLVERWDKRRTVIVMQAIMLLQAFTLAALTLSGSIRIWHIAVLAFILGIANAIEITARQAMLIELAGREALPNAIALQSTAFNLSRVIGPMMAAPFVAFIGENGEGWAFLANGISYLFVIAGLFFVQTRHRADPPEAREMRGGMLAELLEGLRYVLRTRLVLGIVLCAAALGLVSFPIVQQMPVLAQDVLRQAGDTAQSVATRNSLLYTAQGVGALIAAAYLSIYSTIRHRGRLLSAGQAVYVAGLFVIAGTRSTPLMLALIALMGWAMITQMANMNTLIQLQVPNGLRGRTVSIYLWAIQGITPFGSLAVGALVQRLGLPDTLLIIGALLLVGFGTIQLLTPSLRKI